MALTNVQVISKALGELRLVAEGESATAAQGADALAILNQMMAEWSVSDMDLNFPPQDTLSATCPIPTWAESAVISNLAVKCAPQFAAPLTDGLIIKADQGKTLVGRTLINLKLRPADMQHLAQGEHGRWDIQTDGN